MAYTETTSTSYGKRLGDSLKGIITGFVLFIVGTVVLFWNEGNFVKTKKAIDEGQSVVVPVSDVNSVNPELNGKFIHASALADTRDTLTDDLFGVKELAVALDRKVEYYQWVEKSKTETKDKIGGGQEQKTTYTYQQEWTSNPVNSNNFKDAQYQGKNTVLAHVESRQAQAENVSFGAYKLPEFIISSIGGNSPVNMALSPEKKQEWEASILKNMGKPQSATTDSTHAKQELFHVQGHVAYLGQSSSNPQIGDVRVTIVKTEPATISILAKVNGNTFEPYYAENGKNVSQVAQGTVSADNMFAGAHSSNSTWTWILRLVGVVVVIAGLRSMFYIVEMVFKVLPFLANIVGAGVGLVVTIVGFAWALLIIAIAWMFYRPFIAIILIALVIGAFVYLKKRAKNKQQATITPGDVQVEL